MSIPRQVWFFDIKASLLATALVLAAHSGNASDGASAQEDRAAAAVGSGDAAVLTLIRELTVWKERALRAEELLSRAGVPVEAKAGDSGVPIPGSSGSVLSSFEEERMLILSLGRGKGALQGALVSVGAGVIAKVVESREAVSAALVDSSYKGKLVALEGLPVKLAVR